MFFTLCTKCAVENCATACPHGESERKFVGIYTTPELVLAKSCGYVITKIYEIWHYENQGDLVPQYNDTFMALKVLNSGWPVDCKSNELKTRYLLELQTKDNIHIDPHTFVENPTMRLLSKLMLNTLWGRLGIKANKPKFEFVRTRERFNRLFHSNQFDIEYVNLLDDNTLQVQTTLRNGCKAQDL